MINAIFIYICKCIIYIVSTFQFLITCYHCYHKYILTCM
jgi:hypothetical protein